MVEGAVVSAPITAPSTISIVSTKLTKEDQARLVLDPMGLRKEQHTLEKGKRSLSFHLL